MLDKKHTEMQVYFVHKAPTMQFKLENGLWERKGAL